MRRDRKTQSDAQREKTLHKNLSFTAAEAYKLLRTNIQFLLPGEDEAKCKIIGVISSIYGEGKSTTSINLSYVLAEAGKRVLLIDGDMRLPSVANNMQLENAPGLSNTLVSSGNKDNRAIVRKSELFDNWYIMTAGDIPPNPSELLGSNRMRSLLTVLSQQFDYIIVDLPPVNMVSDALTISPMLDGLLLVVREDYITRKEVSACVHQLNIAGAKVLGVVMNCVKTSQMVYGKRKKYKYYYQE